MRFHNHVLLLMILACCPAVALAQKAKTTTQQPPAEQPSDFAQPVEASVPFYIENTDGVPSDDQRSILNGLVKHAQPDAIAAEVLQCPVDKIVLVPHIFWREPKWLDWAEKANHARGAKAMTGPDDKIYMCAEFNYLGMGLTVELGPSSVAASDVVDRIARRIAAKMVRDETDFSCEFLRQKKRNECDQISNRIRNFDDEADLLRKQLREESGLSQTQLSDRITDLQRQLLATDLSLQVTKAREMAMREQLGLLQKLTDSKAADNQMLKTLSRIVDLRKARFERLKAAKSTGAVAQEEADKAEEEMLAAMVDLDRATAALQKTESQSQLDALTAELRRIAIDRAEAEAKKEFLQKANDESFDALLHRRDSDARNDRLQAKLKGIENHRSELQAQLNQAEDALNVPAKSLQISLHE